MLKKFKKISNILSATQIDNLIKKTEEVITENIIKQEEMAADLLAKKQAYETAQRQHDEYQEVINEEKELLDNLVQYKTGKLTKEDGETKVYTGLSNTIHKPAKEGKQLRWVERAVEVLTTEGRALNLKTLLSFIGNRFTDYGVRLETVRTTVTNTGNTFQNTKKLVMYNDKFGLPAWLNADGTPKTDFIKAFMD